MALNIDQAEQQARELLDARIKSVRAVVEARQTVADLRDQLAEAEREDARLFAAALRDGWTAEELKKLGIAEPDKPARTRKRASTKRAPAAKEAPASAEPTPINQNTAAAS